MNSFAALIGSLTGVPASGTNGTAKTGPGETGLFASILQASVSAAPGSQSQPALTTEAGLLLGASLLTAENAEGQGTLELSSHFNTLAMPADAEPQPQAATDGDATLADVIARLTAAPEETLDLEAEIGGLEVVQTLDTQDATVVADADGDAALDTASLTGEVSAQLQTEPLAAEIPREAAPAHTHATAPGQEHASANRPPHAELLASTAPGHARGTHPAQPQQQGVPVTPPPVDPAIASGQPRSASPSGAGGDLSPELAGEVSEDAPAGPGVRGRSNLVQPAEIVRTIAAPAPGQQQVQLVKTANAETASLSSIDTGSNSVHMRAAATPAPAAQPPQVPLHAIAVHIAQQASNGARRFDIRLDPPELGRVEVRLDVSREGHVTTHLVVERSETLDLLQRDARALERALQNAGLDTSEGGMKFSLKDQGGDQPGSAGAGQDGEKAPAVQKESASDETPEIDNATQTRRRYLATGGLDIRI